MISIDWVGRLGNRMIQFAGAWVMSKHSGIELFHKKPDFEQMVHTYGDFDNYFDILPLPDGLKDNSDLLRIDDNWLKNNYKNFNNIPLKNYRIIESMQCPEFLNYYFNEIRSVFIPKKPHVVRDGVLVYCRLGDIPVERSGPLQYYRNALKHVQGKGGWLITDPMSKDDDMVKTLLDDYNLTLYMASPLEQLNFAIGFKEIVSCTGTFGWWMGAFNPGSKIYYYDISSEHAWHAPIFRVCDWEAVKI